MDRIPALHRRIKKLAAGKLLAGTIESFTIIRNPPAGFGTEPYFVGLIKLEDGSKICAQLLAGGMAPEIGAMVIPRMRRIRTMENGLHVNDLKYEVTVAKTEPLISVRSYVLALSGPSGVGKTTITNSLVHLFHALSEQVPMYTTRRSRQGDCEPFVHVSSDKFREMVRSGEIIAHTQLSDSGRYHCGYRRKDIDAIWKQGKLPIVVTDVTLLESLSKHLGRRAVLSCGLLPPGQSRRHMLSALLHRLRSRGQSEDRIAEQLKTAEIDLNAFQTHPHLFDHLFVNDKLETCLESIKGIMRPT